MVRPDYYKNGNIEVFDIIKAFGNDLTGLEAFYFGNILKYVCRFKQKNGVEDLHKAETYLKLLIECQGEQKEETDKAESYEPFDPYKTISVKVNYNDISFYNADNVYLYTIDEPDIAQKMMKAIIEIFNSEMNRKDYKATWKI